MGSSLASSSNLVHIQYNRMLSRLLCRMLGNKASYLQCMGTMIGVLESERLCNVI
jgi:hypothetical protein